MRTSLLVCIKSTLLASLPNSDFHPYFGYKIRLHDPFCKRAEKTFSWNEDAESGCRLSTYNPGNRDNPDFLFVPLEIGFYGVQCGLVRMTDAYGDAGFSCSCDQPLELKFNGSR